MKLPSLHFQMLALPALGVIVSRMALQRALNPMPDFVRKALDEEGLHGTYEARPDYQKNDYLGWIARAKRPETQAKRLRQMLGELKSGGIYMKMRWNG